MTERLPRKLAAILYADVADYSRLTAEDEEGTHRILTAYLDIITAAIGSHDGHIGHFAGDAVLADFNTAVDALACAADIQNRLGTENTKLPEHRRMHFRIGINVGDVIVDRGEVHGDGVNVAARLESLADPGGICISGLVNDAVGNKLPFAREFTGEQKVKNIPDPVRTYRVVLESESAPAARQPPKLPFTVRSSWAAIGVISFFAAAGVALALGLGWLPMPGSRVRWAPVVPAEQGVSETAAIVRPELQGKPAIAVLPFVNMSDDEEQEYFSDGLTADLITDLSKVSGLFVIARQSVFAYKDQTIEPQQVGRELGVRYILEGSVRKVGDRVRINAQLIDANNALHVWADRYDRKVTGIFELQDDVTHNIVAALAIQLTPDEERRLSRPETVSADAYDQLLNGLAPLHRFTPEGHAEARGYFERAIALDPGYARAYANVGQTHADDVVFGWSDDPEKSRQLALQAVSQALQLDDSVPQAHFARASLHLAMNEHEDAIAAAQRSIAVEPSYADGYGMLAQALSHAGMLDEALEAIRAAKRLNPQYSFVYTWIEGHTKFLLGRYEEAVADLREVLERNPAFDAAHLTLAAAYGHLGMSEEALWEVDEVHTVRPGFSLADARRESRYRREEDLNRYVEGLRKAGLPE